MGRRDRDDSRKSEKRRRSRKKKHGRRRQDDDDESSDEKNEDRSRRKRWKEDDDNNSSSDFDESCTASRPDSMSEDDRRRRRKKKSRKNASNRRRDRSIEESSSADYSSEDSRCRKSDKKRSSKRKKSKNRKQKKKRSTKEVTQDDEENPIVTRNHAICDRLHDLMHDHPGLASELPIMLIRMTTGTSFDLRQMSDASAAQGLQAVFSIMDSFGVMQEPSGGWTWKSPGGGTDELFLLRLVRSVINQVGLTMEVVDDYYGMNTQKDKQIEQQKMPPHSAVQNETLDLLTTFSKPTTDAASPALSEELVTLCNMIMDGQSISLEGIPDDNLREAIERLFVQAGLEKSEMEDDSEDEEDDGDPSMGYALMDDGDERSRKRLLEVIAACQIYVDVATVPPSTHHEDSSDDEEDGPAPAGSELAKRRAQQGPSLLPELVQAMAQKRKQQFDEVNGIQKPLDPNKREEWMINPGEHDLLKGIKSGKVMKSRNFQNKKVPSHVVEQQAKPVVPEIQAQVDAIMAAHAEARGPSLMEQHRQKVAAQKAATKKGSKGEFNWSRDKDLDSGRRVDKEAMKMMLGGAASSLKDTFTGGLGRNM